VIEEKGSTVSISGRRHRRHDGAQTQGAAQEWRRELRLLDRIASSGVRIITAAHDFARHRSETETDLGRIQRRKISGVFIPFAIDAGMKAHPTTEADDDQKPATCCYRRRRHIVPVPNRQCSMRTLYLAIPLAVAESPIRRTRAPRPGCDLGLGARNISYCDKAGAFSAHGAQTLLREWQTTLFIGAASR